MVGYKPAEDVKHFDYVFDMDAYREYASNGEPNRFLKGFDPLTNVGSRKALIYLTGYLEEISPKYGVPPLPNSVFKQFLSETLWEVTQGGVDLIVLHTEGCTNEAFSTLSSLAHVEVNWHVDDEGEYAVYTKDRDNPVYGWDTKERRARSPLEFEINRQVKEIIGDDLSVAAELVSSKTIGVRHLVRKLLKGNAL